MTCRAKSICANMMKRGKCDMIELTGQETIRMKRFALSIYEDEMTHPYDREAWKRAWIIARAVTQLRAMKRKELEDDGQEI